MITASSSPLNHYAHWLKLESVELGQTCERDSHIAQLELTAQWYQLNQTP
jgi:hypothetical protein